MIFKDEVAYRTDIRDAERVGKDSSPSLPAFLWLGLHGVCESYLTFLCLTHVKGNRNKTLISF